MKVFNSNNPSVCVGERLIPWRSSFVLFEAHVCQLHYLILIDLICSPRSIRPLRSLTPYIQLYRLSTEHPVRRKSLKHVTESMAMPLLPLSIEALTWARRIKCAELAPNSKEAQDLFLLLSFSSLLSSCHLLSKPVTRCRNYIGGVYCRTFSQKQISCRNASAILLPHPFF